VATIIASQAVISGAFSLTRQAVRLGYSPPIEVTHTSSKEIGQIYIGRVNWILMAATIGLVLGFRSSSNLAAAYGVAVSTTMVITTMLYFVVTRDLWHWSTWTAGALCGLLLIVDVAFFVANGVKIAEGGWFPVMIGLGVVTVMTTWKRGRELLAARLRADLLPVDLFLADIRANPPVRVPGAAIFMTAHAEGVPNTVLHNLKHNKVLHERVAFLTIQTAEVPTVPSRQRLEIIELGEGICRLIGHYGFMEDPDVGDLLAQARARGIDFQLMQTTFFLGRETVIPAKRPGMSVWREWLFSLVSRNAQPVRALFQIPPNRVVELGTQIEI
jgi:KUP system potassium uptake protein